jgi:hypothetical protein
MERFYVEKKARSQWTVRNGEGPSSQPYETKLIAVSVAIAAGEKALLAGRSAEVLVEQRDGSYSSEWRRELRAESKGP